MIQIDQLTEVATTENATTIGVLMAISLALGGAVVYLHSRYEKRIEQFIKQIEKNNDAIREATTLYQELLKELRK